MKKLNSKLKNRKGKTRKGVKRHAPAQVLSSSNAERPLSNKNTETAVATTLAKLPEATTTLSVLNIESDEVSSMPVVRLQALAAVLDTSYQTLWRWSSKTDQLPSPILVDKTSGRDYPVYHEAEARVIIEHVSAHFQQFSHFRKDHTGTVRLIADQIESLRAINFHVQSGEQKHGTKENRKNPRKKIRKGSRSR